MGTYFVTNIYLTSYICLPNTSNNIWFQVNISYHGHTDVHTTCPFTNPNNSNIEDQPQLVFRGTYLNSVNFADIDRFEKI